MYLASFNAGANEPRKSRIQDKILTIVNYVSRSRPMLGAYPLGPGKIA
jgi:hypothetical protein